MAFNVPKAFGAGKDRIFEELTVISVSNDGNNILLMDKNRSFYELSHDKVLEGYNKQQEKQHKAEMKHAEATKLMWAGRDRYLEEGYFIKICQL